MPMNLILREKRKELGLTQEKIAEYLGVSTPAVNKWEKGATYPDISLLPPLARLLQTDLNTLLCFHEGLSEQEINHFTVKLTEVIRKDGYATGFAMGEEKVREYPHCGQLIHHIALILDGALMFSELNEDDKEQYQEKILTLYERIADSEDDKVRDNAIFMCVSKYINKLEFEKAQEMMALLPDKNAVVDKYHLQAILYTKENKLASAAEVWERKLLFALNDITMILISLADLARQEKDDERVAHLAGLCRQITNLFELWDYNAFVIPFQTAVEKKNVSESLNLLEAILSAAMTPWDIQNSILYQHINGTENQTGFSAQLLPMLLSNVEKDSQFAFLHSNPEFQRIIKCYRAKSKK